MMADLKAAKRADSTAELTELMMAARTAANSAV
jgi:hypothetical protein